MSQEAPAGRREWKQHAIPAAITLVPMAITAVAAWSALNVQSTATAETLRETRGQVAALTERMNSADRQSAAVLARLDDMSQRESEMNAKLDKVLERGGDR